MKKLNGGENKILSELLFQVAYIFYSLKGDLGVKFVFSRFFKNGNVKIIMAHRLDLPEAPSSYVQCVY